MAAKTITIFSSKGGVGKTVIATNLAALLAQTGKRTLIIDYDYQIGRDVSRLLNLQPKISMAEAFAKIEAAGEMALMSSYMAVHPITGLHFIPCVREAAQIKELSKENVKMFFEKAAQVYDYIIVDTGRSIDEALIHVLDQSNLILLVATPDVLAVYQMKWCMDFFQSLHFPMNMIKLVLNRSESRGSVPWQEVQAALVSDIFCHIPSDGRAVGMALNRGIPCVIDTPKSPVSESFKTLIAKLQQPNIFVSSMSATNVQRADNKPKVNVSEFWEKLGVSPQSVRSEVSPGQAEDDELMLLKQKVHAKLVDRLNLEGLTTETLSNPEAMLGLKKKAEQVVGNLLVEETGGRVTSHQDRTVLVRDIVNEALGLGPLEEFLADSEVTDIMVNNKDQIYVEKHGTIQKTNKRFISDGKVRSTIERIIAPLGRRIDESTPMVNARLPDGSRINAIIPPLSLQGPMITIRKFARERLMVNDLLERYKSLNKPMSVFLESAVIARRNMIISGGTGAGKTTILNIISQFIPDRERIITIEDAAELQLKKNHWARLEARTKNVEGRGEVTIRDLFINSLRMRPDRVIIGECRGPEVLDMLQAMNTGHDGSMTTIHANSTQDVITRMHSMILLAGVELPVRAIHEMFASAIHVLVHVSRLSDGTRKILQVSEITGLDDDYQLVMKDIFVFDQQGIDANGKVVGEYKATGHIPRCLEQFKRMSLPVTEDMFRPT